MSIILIFVFLSLAILIFSLPNSVTLEDEYGINQTKKTYNNSESTVLGGTLDEIALEYSQTALAINPRTNTIYSISEEDDADYNMHVINGSTNQIMKNISIANGVSNYPDALAVNPITNKIYVASYNEGLAISEIDGQGFEQREIKVGESPEHLTINSHGDKVYVANSLSDSVSVVDTIKDMTIINITVGENPSGIASNDRTGKVYVSNENSDTISVIDNRTNTVIKNITGIYKPTTIVANPSTNTIYVASSDGARIVVIDGKTDKIAKAIFLDSSHYSGDFSMAANPMSNLIYVANSEVSSVSVIDGNDERNNITEIAKDQVNKPRSIALNINTNLTYIGTSDNALVRLSSTFEDEEIKDSDTFKEIQSSSLQRPGIKVGEDPNNIAIDPSENKIYVAYSNPQKVSIIDGSTDKVLKDIELDWSPQDIAISEYTDKIYLTYYDTKTISIIDEKNNFQIKNITAAHDYPDRIFIGGNYFYITDSLYNNLTIIDDLTSNVVENMATNYTISEIATNTNTEQAFFIDDNLMIHYGSTIPEDEYSSRANFSYIDSIDGLTIDQAKDILYIANQVQDYVHVIDPYINKELKKIPMGMGQNYLAWDMISDGKHFKNIGGPTDLAIDPNTDRLYITNYVSGNITVVDIKNNEIITSFIVGDSPSEIAVNPINNVIYVVNPESDTVSVIDGSKDKVVVGTTFRVNPPEAGTVKCNGQETVVNEYIHIPYNTTCIAEPNNGYRFSSWTEKSENNATKTISKSTDDNSLFAPLLTHFQVIPQDNSSSITMSKYGDLTVNFQSVPPPISSEYLVPLYGIIATTIVGWSIPSIVAWINAKRKGRTSDDYHKRIIDLYNDGKLDYVDSKALNKIRNDLSATYAKGKISEQLHQNLKEEIGVLYEEIHRKRIDYLDSYPIKHDTKDDRLVATIRRDIDEDFAKGKITEQHYNLLNKKIESIVNTDENKKESN